MGQTEADILLRARLDLLSKRIREKVADGEQKVTDEQTADYYKNEARFAPHES